MKKRQKYTAKKGAWFAKFHGNYIPASWQGWLTYIPYIGFLIATMWYVADTSNYVYEIPIRIMPYWICAAVIMIYIARRKS